MKLVHQLNEFPIVLHTDWICIPINYGTTKFGLDAMFSGICAQKVFQMLESGVFQETSNRWNNWDRRRGDCDKSGNSGGVWGVIEDLP